MGVELCGPSSQLQFCSSFSPIMKLLILMAMICLVIAGPTVYKVDKEEGTAEKVMLPVSSTVIPLDDLPELQVGYGFGLANKEKIAKPAYLEDIKLITSKNKHRFIVPGGVKQLTKEEFEAFTNQV